MARHFDDPTRLLDLVSRLSDRYEAGQAQPWAVSDAPADYIDKLLAAIVGIEIPVQRWVGKFKLSQNRPLADRLGAIAGLTQTGEPQAQAMAQLIPDTHAA
jgi:transcriptional regulator